MTAKIYFFYCTGEAARFKQNKPRNAACFEAGFAVKGVLAWNLLPLSSLEAH